jgi:hypothetical protein
MAENKKNPRLEQLDNWLFKKMDALCLWQKSDKNMLVEAFRINGRVCIVVRYKGEHEGFDIYTSADTNLVDETFTEAERRLGVAVCPGCGWSIETVCQTEDCKLGRACECGGGLKVRLAQRIYNRRADMSINISEAIELAKLVLGTK